MKTYATMWTDFKKFGYERERRENLIIGVRYGNKGILV